MRCSPRATTDGDGRVAAIGGDLAPGDYRLRFERSATGGPFYPEVVVVFRSLPTSTTTSRC